MHDAIVIGGGFFGVVIAAYLRERRGLGPVAVLEREADLLLRASLRNQARVHNGYHYPRSFVTAYRSRANLPRFVADFPSAVERGFTKLYAIARESKVSARQFERFCAEIGARLEPAPRALAALFSERHIEASYRVEEYAFDAGQLRAWAHRALKDTGVELRLRTAVREVLARPGGGAVVRASGAEDAVEPLEARYVFNCTYSGLNAALGPALEVRATLKHEITELALVEPPAPLRDVGITVMDGAFFSCMPYPARGLHTLSHVRYTPHLHWHEDGRVDPYEVLAAYPRQSRVEWMLRDASRFMPVMRHARAVDSLFEVKTVLAKNEVDDGRPILFEPMQGIPGGYNILGGKLDNVYDILARLDGEPLVAGGPEARHPA